MKSPAFRFYPSDFMGSPDVQAMDLHEVGAYIFLLCTAWQSDRHGYLPDDDEKLRRWARMDRERWSQSRETLLAKFPVVDHGWRANARMVFEAKKQVAFSEAQSAKGKLGGRPKKAKIKPGLSDEKPELYSGISPEKPSVSVSVSDSDLKNPSRKREVNKDSDPRHVPFKLACEMYAAHKGVTFVWDGGEAKQLSALLAAAPLLTLATFQKCLNHRARSVVTHGDRPREWIGTILRYQEGPLDQFGKPVAGKPQLFVTPQEDPLARIREQERKAQEEIDRELSSAS